MSLLYLYKMPECQSLHIVRDVLSTTGGEMNVTTEIVVTTYLVTRTDSILAVFLSASSARSLRSRLASSRPCILYSPRSAISSMLSSKVFVHGVSD